MTTLRQGDRGPAVFELQLFLAMTGHDPGPLDGIFGPRTLTAVRWSRAPKMGGSADVDDEEIAELRALPRRAVEVPRMLTPVAAVDMRIALTATYFATHPSWNHLDVEALPVPPAPVAVRVALTQLAVEHGLVAWDAHTEGRLYEQRIKPPEWLRPPLGEHAYVYVWTNNIGNRQVIRQDEAEHLSHGPSVPHFSMSPVEGSGASAHKATSAHYAYPSAAEGAAAYWRFLRDHCADALAAFERGDPAGAAHELKVGEWHFSGDEAAYAHAMVDVYARLA